MGSSSSIDRLTKWTGLYERLLHRHCVELEHLWIGGVGNLDGLEDECRGWKLAKKNMDR